MANAKWTPFLQEEKRRENQNRLGKVEKKTAWVKHFYTKSSKCMEKITGRVIEAWSTDGF